MSTGSERDVEHSLLHSAFETLSDNIVVHSSNGTIVMANGTWSELIEQNNGQGVGDTDDITYLGDISGIDERDAAHAADGLTALLEGRRDQFDFEYQIRSTDEQRWLLLRALPFLHQGERHVVSTHTDITTRKKRENALRDAYEISTADKASLDEQIEELLQVAHKIIGTEYTTLSRVRDGQYVFENVTNTMDPVVESGDTIPLAEVPPCKKVVHTQETTAVRSIETEAPELSAPNLGIASYLGSPVIVDDEVYGTLCCFSTEPREGEFTDWEVTFVDLLSKWFSYELSRREREQKLQHLKENVSDVIWMSSPEKEEIEFISDSYEDVWGRMPSSLLKDSSSFVEAIHPDDRDKVERALTEQQAYPDEYEETYRIIQPSGEVRWIHDRSAGVYANGELRRIVGIATDITDRKEHEQELAYQKALLEAQAETTIDGLLVVDSDRSIRYHNSRFLEVWDISEETAATQSDEELIESVHDRLANPEEFQERVEYLYTHPKEQNRDTIELIDGRWLDRYSAPVIGCDGTNYGRLWAFRDITEHNKQKKALEQQRDELVQLQRVNTLVRQSIQALQDTTTRAEIETAVCEALTESEVYQTAWIADWTETEDGSQVIRPRTASGVDESYLEGIPTTGNSPTETALRTGQVQVVNNITTATEFPPERQEIELAHGHYTLAAVPLQKDDTIYGVIVVYAPPDHTISETEREILADLGQSIALAIQRVHSQQSLTAQTAASLNLRIPDTEFVFGTVSRELDAKISLERRVNTNPGAVVYYLSVEDADIAQVSDHLQRDSLITTCTVVRDGDSAQPALVEAHLAEDSHLPIDILTDYGATITSARAAAGDILLRVELPPQTDVRTVFTAVQEVAPAIELINKQQIERPTKTATAMQDQVTAQLTEKQEAALKAAYTRGYYAWPRESTMEEIAETFDISAPTLHYRLRKAHNTVIGSLLDPQQVCDNH